MNKMNPPALLLIDIQKGHDELAYWGGQRNNPHAETKAKALLDVWRSKRWPIYHVKHNSTTVFSPLRPGHSGNDFKRIVAPLPGEKIIEKTVNSAFIGTDLQNQLEKAGIKELVVVGMTTDHCVSTSTRMAGNLGFQTYVVEDAVACFNKVGSEGQQYSAELIHETALASLHQEFAEVLTSTDLLAKLALLEK